MKRQGKSVKKIWNITGMLKKLDKNNKKEKSDEIFATCYVNIFMLL